MPAWSALERPSPCQHLPLGETDGAVGEEAEDAVDDQADDDDVGLAVLPARVIMWPMPLVALYCSTTTRPSSDEVTANRMPSRKPGSAPGSTTCRMNSPRLMPDGLGQLGVPAVDAAQAVVRVHVDRDEG